MQNTLKQTWLLLQPSWLSGLIAIIASLATLAVAIVVSNYEGSSLQQELFSARQGGPITSFNFQAVTDNLARNSVISNMPLFLFWAALGVIVYLFATSIWAAFSHAEELREEMEYVNAPRQNLVRTAALHAIVRLAALGLWIAYLQLFLKVLLPYVLAAAHVAAVGLSLANFAYSFLALFVLFVGLQVHVIFLRLVLLRLRAFGNDLTES